MSKSKILYVEDEEVLAMLVRDHLVRNGFDVYWTPRGMKRKKYLKK